MTTAMERVRARVDRLGPLGSAGVPAPLLTLPEFFDGNDDVGSILCHVVLSGVDEDEDDAPAPQQVRAVLEQVRDRPEVCDVRVVVLEMDDPEFWPFAEQVLVVTSADAETVRGWFPADYAPDHVRPQTEDRTEVEPYDVPAGQGGLLCRWD
jgi:hypothetical protein